MSDRRFPTIAEVEQEHILRALQTFGGQKPAAAQALGISLKTLYNKLRHYEALGEMAARFADYRVPDDEADAA